MLNAAISHRLSVSGDPTPIRSKVSEDTGRRLYESALLSSSKRISIDVGRCIEGRRFCGSCSLNWSIFRGSTVEEFEKGFTVKGATPVSPSRRKVAVGVCHGKVRIVLT